MGARELRRYCKKNPPTEHGGGLPRDRIELPTRGFSVLSGGKDSNGLSPEEGGRVASTVAADALELRLADFMATAQGTIVSALQALEIGRLDLAQEELSTLLDLLKSRQSG